MRTPSAKVHWPRPGPQSDDFDALLFFSDVLESELEDPELDDPDEPDDSADPDDPDDPESDEDPDLDEVSLFLLSAFSRERLRVP